MKVLKGHNSPETAYLVDDYPYGFRLRCKIRYWLEYKSGHGYRLVSQTTDPKRSYEYWNKPKSSTYSLLGVMILDEQDHVTWTGMSYYMDANEIAAWKEQYGSGLDERGHKIIAQFEKYHEIRRAKKEAQEQQEAQTQSLSNA